MRISLVLMTTVFCLSATAGVSQLVTINAKQASVEEIIDVVQKQTGYVFFYKERVLKEAKRITVNVKDMPVQSFLVLAFKEQPFTWSFENQTVVLELKENFPVISSAQAEIRIDTLPRQLSVSGIVTNSNGEPVPYASVSVKGRASGVTTGKDGSFTIQAMINDIIVVSSVGYAPYEHRVRSAVRIRIELSLTGASMKEVVTIGIMTRKAESFTGSAVTVTKDELLRAGSQNVLQSLKNIDPSFRLVENIELGSDPNQLPEIVMRGRSALPDLTGSYSGNPNQPLFILDGFETTLQRVYDLDMNRIKTITLLKDAAAKAVYGAKAGNGVVVIETLQPQRGKLQLSYSANINVEAPDLTGYNLMDAQEKLQFEVERGMFQAAWDPNLATFRESLYNQLYQDVHTKGVNTYWLSKPLQTGIGQRHSVMMEGGDDYLRYGATFFYNKISGAMKGSDRVTISGNTMLSYRYKNLLFRNTLDVSQNDASNSPYGSFSDYAKLNAYWTPYDENGNLKKALGAYPNSLSAGGQDITYNPMYNASLNVINGSSYQQVIDNFYVEWNAVRNLRFKGSIGYTNQRNSADDFRPPGHTDFIGYTEENGLINYKGKWIKTNGMSRSIESNIGADYNLYLGKHSFFSNVTLNISDIRNNSNVFVAEGFGSDNVSDISMANYYERGGSPTGSDNHTRSIGVVGALNYTFDNRFLFDASYRTNASSIYGKNARWGSFWSLGTGWNLHNEKMIQDLRLFQQLRIRGSMGYTGVQNADSYLTLATYDYVSTAYDGIKGATLMALPNPDLRWQKNLDYNAGIDVSMLNNRLAIRFEMYKRITTNLLQDISAAPSMGFNTFRANIGRTLNTGEELSIRYQVYNNNKNRSYLNISVTGTRNRNRLTNIADAFRSYNQEQDAKVSGENVLHTKPVARFYEGQSMTAIWAMRSLGIDPSTGTELFLNREGKMTYNWTSNELIIAGDTEPKVNGTFGVNMGYKGFSLSLICSFRFGAQLYNATLVERVENIDGRRNLDRRIKDAWQNTGDIAIYKEPQVSAAVNSISFTKPTTRFVQDNDEIFFSTINLGYDVQSRKLLRRMGMERLRVTFYTNELARISSITTERGTSYPFARNFSFSLQTTF